MNKPHSDIPIIRLSQVIPFVRWLDLQGVSTERSLRGWGLPAKPDEAPDLFVPSRSLYGWIGATARTEGIEDFGVHVGRSSRVEDIGALGRSIQMQAGLRGVLTALVGQVNQHSSHATFGWREEGQDVWLWRRPTPGSEVGELGHSHIEGYLLLLLTNIVRLAAGPEWAPEVARVQMEAVSPLLREELPGARLDRGASETAIRLPGAMLSSPSGALPESIAAPADAAPEPWVGVLRRGIAVALPVGAPSIEWGAEIAWMSPRTLQRRLQECGLTWFELVDQVRRATALRLLGDADVQIHDIARAVGYSNQANFSHAFRRWTGSSPSRYRRERAPTLGGSSAKESRSR